MTERVCRHGSVTPGMSVPSVRSTSGNLRPVPGTRMSLLRILMTNACSYNCHYCPMRRDRSMPRTLLKPDGAGADLPWAHQRGWCQGLFVTTGIPARPVKVVDGLITALELLRERHRFGGYIHVKLVAGAEQAQIERLDAAGQPGVAQRRGAVRGAALTAIAPEKNFALTVGRPRARAARWSCTSGRSRRDGKPHDPLHPGGRSGMTVQFVVGATPDTDRKLLDASARLSAGRGRPPHALQRLPPIRDTPMENVQATPALREHRLYQADYLAARATDSPPTKWSTARAATCRSVDPKSAWALAHPERFPVEVGSAAYEELLRVPGHRPHRGAPDRRAAARTRSAAWAPAPAGGGDHARRRIPHSSRPPAADRTLDRAARLLGARGGRGRAPHGVRGEPRHVPPRPEIDAGPRSYFRSALSKKSPTSLLTFSCTSSRLTPGSSPQRSGLALIPSGVHMLRKV